MDNFRLLIQNISVVHKELQQHAANAVNQSLTIRNWLIGYYIIEFEQNGEDRAKYGSNLIKKLAIEFKSVSGMDERSLRSFRLFYKCYPQISTYIFDLKETSIRGTLSPILKKLPIRGTVSPELKIDKVPGKQITTKLSYSHLEQLIKIDDKLKRTFYEIECIKGTWSVRELKRQIASLYYERSGLSAKPEKLSELIAAKTKPQNPTDIIKNIYAFEFLDLKVKDAVEESDLESALLDHLKEFIIELGNGFCFEARQKRILIGENYYFIDLAFYHRILKCHILIELKIGEFNHGDIGQLNTYLNFFKEEISEPSDNPPIGILLVAEKDKALVKYATAGMDENLFVQKYLVQLPSQQQLETYVNSELQKLK